MRVSQLIIASVMVVIVAMAATVLAAGPEQVFTPSIAASNPSGLHAVITVTSLPKPLTDKQLAAVEGQGGLLDVNANGNHIHVNNVRLCNNCVRIK
jgi:hypothetical protein